MAQSVHARSEVIVPTLHTFISPAPTARGQSFSFCGQKRKRRQRQRRRERRAEKNLPAESAISTDDLADM